MQPIAPILGNESISLMPYEDDVLESLRQSRTAIATSNDPSVVISARCDLLKDELRELYERLLATN
ncbi:hypothetical protein C5Y96_15545 [Blastopirellula marina]|uniref:Uncharacterized protein n=2 Tax=Pirellulales TaxID=2691354 RepID=A0A2S8FAJ4_9BACT|nr:hypothetical protein C5Y96_15545 [Blastopirellula marina]RCS50360.1 hypothetical protein DTL36_15565 [Bremerella cremea]